MIPLLKREGDSTVVRVEISFRQKNRETNREYQELTIAGCQRILPPAPT